jgi:hypothetical protein
MSDLHLGCSIWKREGRRTFFFVGIVLNRALWRSSRGHAAMLYRRILVFMNTYPPNICVLLWVWLGWPIRLMLGEGGQSVWQSNYHSRIQVHQGQLAQPVRHTWTTRERLSKCGNARPAPAHAGQGTITGMIILAYERYIRSNVSVYRVPVRHENICEHTREGGWCRAHTLGSQPACSQRCPRTLMHALCSKPHSRVVL